MSSKRHRDKTRYKNKQRKQQMNCSAEPSEAEQEAAMIEGSRERVKQRLIEMNGSKKHKLVDSENLEKMSDILLDYAQPFLDIIKTEEKIEYEKSIEISMMLWNCAIMKESPGMRRKIMKMLKPAMPDTESKNVVKYMLDRKRRMYPDNKRLILNYELNELPGGGYHLTVGSTLDRTAAKKYTENSQNVT